MGALFALSEYIRELILTDYTNIEKIIDLPNDLVDGNRLQFEIETIKYFLIEIGLFVVYLSAECDNKHCRKMQATTKFRYRCSAHRKPKDCNSIQYMVHTLDLFTEKMSVYHIGSLSSVNEKKAKKDMGDLCRRVYRIFAHLLCTRFILFFKKYQLVPNALFKREIQIPAASLYFSRKARKEKLKIYKQQKRKTDNVKNEFMRCALVAELESNEVY